MKITFAVTLVLAVLAGCASYVPPMCATGGTDSTQYHHTEQCP